MRWKRLTAALLACTLCTAAFGQVPQTQDTAVLTASAEDPEEEALTFENFTYEIKNDGTVKITDYTVPASQSGDTEEGTPAPDVVIPAEIDGKAVTEIGNSAFIHSVGSKLTIPDSVTRIDAFAFDSAGVEELVLPDSIEHVGMGAFQNCTSLKKVTLSKNMHALLCWTFTGCEALSEIEGMEHITKFQEYCLYGTPYLAALREKDPLVIINHNVIDASTCEGDVVIPDGVTRICSEAFTAEGHYETEETAEGIIPYQQWVEGESLVTSLHIPASCTMLDPACLRKVNMKHLRSVMIDPENPRYSSVDGMILSHNGTVLELVPADMAEVTVPESVTEIGSALSVSEVLTSVTLPEGLTKISENMFSGCTNLKSITIPDTVTRIGKNAFSGTGLESITIPDGVTYVHGSAFLETPLYEAQKDEPVKYADNWALSLGNETAELREGTVGIADITHDEEDYDEFYSSSPTGLVIPDSVRYICAESLPNLVTLTAPAELIEAYPMVFVSSPWSKEHQETVTLDNGLKVRANIVVDGYDCTGDITVPDGIVGIAPGAFYYSNSEHDGDGNIWESENPKFGADITSIKLPDSIRRIEGEQFTGCQKLTDIEFPEHLEYLGSLVGSYFNYGVTAGGEVYHPDSLTLPETLTDGKYILQNTNVGCLTIPGSLKAYPDGYQSGAGWTMTNAAADYLIFSEGVEELGDVSVSCSKAVYLPKSLEFIGQGAFCEYRNQQLTDVYYGGSEEDWERVSVLNGGYWFVHNANLYDATFHFNAKPEDVLALAAAETKETPGETPATDDMLCGDVNDDKTVDIMDVIAINKFLLGSASLDDAAKRRADVDQNGDVDSTDSLNILKYVVALVKSLPLT